MIVKIPFLSWTGKAALEVEVSDGIEECLRLKAAALEVEVSDGIEEYLRLKAAVEISVGNRANLAGANLGDAYLHGANLRDANLRDANLRGANLGDANLRGANLGDANLRDANLGGANLRGANLAGANLGDANLGDANLGGANLRGANLGGKKLVGERPILMLGPIGSESRYLTAYLTEAGVMISAGCFFDTINQFAARVEEVHGTNQHGQEYRAAIAMVEAHAEIWMPEKEEKEAA